MNFPREVLFGSALFQGYQLQHVYYTQEISHITTLLKESIQNSQSGKLLRMTAKCFRLELGITFELCKTPFESFASYLTPCNKYI